MHPNFDNLGKYIIVTPEFTINTFLQRVGLKPDDSNIARKLKSRNLDGTTLHNNVEFWNNPEIQGFYQDILPLIIENSKQQYDLLMSYLAPIFSLNNVFVVDIGWRGSMQKRLQEILVKQKRFCNLNGYYIGIENSDDNFHGYLFKGKKETKGKICVDGGYGLMETFFLAQEGTTIGYQNDGNKVVPILDAYEISDEVAKHNIEKVKIGALGFVSDMKRCYLTLLHSDTIVCLTCEYFEKLALFPSKTDLLEFSRVVFNDTTNAPLVQIRGLRYYLSNPRRLTHDYHITPWKLGFLNANIWNSSIWGIIYKLLMRIRTD